jgi:hypothetical protein
MRWLKVLISILAFAFWIGSLYGFFDGLAGFSIAKAIMVPLLVIAAIGSPLLLIKQLLWPGNSDS